MSRKKSKNFYRKYKKISPRSPKTFTGKSKNFHREIKYSIVFDTVLWCYGTIIHSIMLGFTTAHSIIRSIVLRHKALMVSEAKLDQSHLS